MAKHENVTEAQRAAIFLYALKRFGRDAEEWISGGLYSPTCPNRDQNIQLSLIHFRAIKAHYESVQPKHVQNLLEDLQQRPEFPRYTWQYLPHHDSYNSGNCYGVAILDAALGERESLTNHLNNMAETCWNNARFSNKEAIKAEGIK